MFETKSDFDFGISINFGDPGQGSTIFKFH